MDAWRDKWILTSLVIHLQNGGNYSNKATQPRKSTWSCAVLCLVAKLCPTLCSPRDCSPPDTSVHGIFQARILEWVAILYSGGLPDPGISPMSLASPALAGGFFTTVPVGEIKHWSQTSLIPPANCLCWKWRWGWEEPSLAASLAWICVSCCCSVAQSCPTLCNPMDHSMSGFSILYYLLDFAQTHIHWVGHAIQPPHRLLPSSFALNLAQHQGLFQWVSSLHLYWGFSFSISPSNEYSGLISFRIDWFDISTSPLICCVALSKPPFLLVKMVMPPILPNFCWERRLNREGAEHIIDTPQTGADATVLIFGISDTSTLIKWVQRASLALPLPCMKNSLSTLYKISIYKPFRASKTWDHLPCLHLQIVFLRIWKKKVYTCKYTIRICYNIQTEGQAAPSLVSGNTPILIANP